jgi:hypothetical protein
VLTVALWAAGAALCFCVMLGSNLLLQRRLLQNRKRVERPSFANQKPVVYQTAELSVPCLYGFLRPAIYLPESLCETSSDDQLEQIILHERIHYRHKDFFWSFVRMLLAALYWFHPLAWLCASLSKKDAELACDEAVIECLGEDKRGAYGKLLLEIAASGTRRMPCSAMTMSRQGRNLKKRLRAIAQKKKYSWGVCAVLVVIVAAAAAVTFTGIPDKVLQSSKETLTMEQLLAWDETDALGQITYEKYTSYKNCNQDETDGAEESAKETCGIFTSALHFPLAYQGTDYELVVGYDSKNWTINEMGLVNQTTKEWGIIYAAPDGGNQMYHVTELNTLLEHDTYLDDYITYQLPSGLTGGTCYLKRAAYSSYAMRLFLSEQNQENGVYGYRYSPVWSADGGVVQCNQITFDEETACPQYQWSDYYGMGVYVKKADKSTITHLENGELESVSGCEGNASIEGVAFCQELDTLGDCVWYQTPEGNKGAEPDGSSLFPKKIWIASLTKKNDATGFGYVFFLDAQKYSKQDAIALLRSARIEKDGAQEHQILREQVETVMPEAVKNELEKGFYSAVSSDGEETLLLKNDEKNATMRLEFVLQEGILYQYQSKKYGFVDSLPEEWITQKEAEALVKKFAEQIMGVSVEVQPTEAPDGYEDEEMYAAYRDNKGGRYVVQLNHNIVVQYDSLSSNYI